MGSVVISLDAELGWGFHDHDDPPERRIRRARWGWRRLLELFETFDVPATWAVVGHLLLEECDGVHADHPLGEGWFSRERKSWADRPQWRFAPDLVEAVLAAGPDHELACHSYSHVVFDGSVGRDVTRAEVAGCLAAAESYDVSMRSFVHPRRVVGHRDVLSEWGFDCYRGRPTRSRSVAGKLRNVVSPDPVLVSPSVDEYGLISIPESLYLFGFEGRARSLIEPVFGDPIVREACRGIDAAAEQEGVFHMWLHPNNVTDDRDVSRLRAVLTHLDARRDEVEIATMADVARHTRETARPQANPVD
jgi:peptidoglycan/xylan/chitin deacetylase (PgdA/CDA1 family)